MTDPAQPCPCGRILVGVEHMSRPDWHGGHDWIDDGRVCCLARAQWKGQLCWCRATRWVPNQ